MRRRAVILRYGSLDISKAPIRSFQQVGKMLQLGPGTVQVIVEKFRTSGTFINKQKHFYYSAARAHNPDTLKVKIQDYLIKMNSSGGDWENKTIE